MIGRLMEGEGGIADDALLVAGGVAGIAAVDQLRRQAALAGSEQQAVDRVGAAGLLWPDVGVELQDVLRRYRGRPGWRRRRAGSARGRS